MIINLEEHIKNLLSSYQKLTGLSLTPQGAQPNLTQYLDSADFVLLSHGKEADPILNYGNQKALSLWEMTYQEFVTTPSRLTAEPLRQEARQKALEKVQTQGYVDQYTGIRISKSGKRFRIHNAIIWNVYDFQTNQQIGQAATFAKWEFL